MLDAGIVEDIARLEVVRAIEDNIGRGHEGFHRIRRDIGNDALDPDGAVDSPQPLFGRARLGTVLPRISFIKQDLPVEIRPLDEIPVHETDRTDAGPHEHIGQRTAQRTASHDQRPPLGKPRLPFRADFGKPFLAGVPFTHPVRRQPFLRNLATPARQSAVCRAMTLTSAPLRSAASKLRPSMW